MLSWCYKNTLLGSTSCKKISINRWKNKNVIKMNILTVKLKFTYLKRKWDEMVITKTMETNIFIPPPLILNSWKHILIQSRIQADTYTFCQNVFPIGFHTVKEEILYKYYIISIYSLKNFIFKNNVHFQDSNNHVIPK